MTHSLVFYGLTILLFLLLSAFFSAAETALTAISRARIWKLVTGGNWRAKIASNLKRDKESLIGTVLLGSTAVNVAVSAIATSAAIDFFGHAEGLVAAVTLALTLLLVVFAEILPKTYAIQNAEATALALAPIISLLVKLFYPVTYTVRGFIRLLLRMFGIDITKSSTFISATDIIRGTIELHHREGRMVKQDRDMLGSILDLDDIVVEQIMIHRKQVETLDAGLPAEKLIAEAVSTMHSRLPVWQGEPDNIIGVLHVKNLVRLLGERQGKVSAETVLALCHKPWFIPEATSLRDQLLAFRNHRQHLAIVVDEYGAWQGIVTLEDIIEEIVGNIDDEHDEAESAIQRAGKDLYYVNGDLSLRDINRALGWSLPDEHASTVAGLVIHEAESIPAVGDHFDLCGFRFTVVGKDARQITRLKVEKLANTAQQDLDL